MIPRQITTEFHTLLKEHPIATVLGPRQAGKTTLAQTALPDYDYVSLEQPEIREFATEVLFYRHWFADLSIGY